MTDPTYSHSDSVTLKEHLEKSLDAEVRRLETRLTAMEDAVYVANIAMEKRLDGMNEFRAALKDSAAMTVTRQEMNALIIPIRDALDELKTYRYLTEGKASQRDVNAATLLAGIGLAISIISLLLRLFNY